MASRCSRACSGPTLGSARESLHPLLYSYPARAKADSAPIIRNGLCGVQGGASGIRGREADKACIAHTSSGDARSSK